MIPQFDKRPFCFKQLEMGGSNGNFDSYCGFPKSQISNLNLFYILCFWAN